MVVTGGVCISRQQAAVLEDVLKSDQGRDSLSLEPEE